MVSDLSVLLYIPNIIDYLRLVLLFVGLQQFSIDGNASKFAVYYLSSYGLDAIDGMAARYFNQCSKLGVYLDMVADRLSTCLLLHIVAQAQFDQGNDLGGIMFYFILISVEVVSHGTVMLMSELGGFHQKEMKSKSRSVQLYLTNKKILFSSCASFEFFLLCTLMQTPAFVTAVFAPGFFFRSYANLRRLLDVTVFRERVSKEE